MRKNKIMNKYRAKISEEDKALIDDSFALADRIHFLLEKHGITQRELAKRLNKKESQISKWLSGGHNFTQATLTKIGLAIGEKIYTIPDEKELRSYASHAKIDHQFKHYFDNIKAASGKVVRHSSKNTAISFEQAIFLEQIGYNPEMIKSLDTIQ